MTATPFPLLAAVLVAKDSDVDAVLARVAAILRGEGSRLAGFLQGERDGEGACCAAIEVEDIAGGGRYVISQDLGPGARGCRLDPQALTALVVPALAGLDRDPDLLLLNRFGKAEASGGGFRPVIEAAFERSIPVLTAAREDYAPAWEAFSGEFGIVMPAHEASILDWARGALEASGRARHAA